MRLYERRVARALAALDRAKHALWLASAALAIALAALGVSAALLYQTRAPRVEVCPIGPPSHCIRAEAE